MSYPVDFGILQIGLILLILIAVALLVSALVKVRRVGPRVLLGRGAGGLVLLVVAVLLLWVATLMQTYLGLSGEIKAAHVVVSEVAGEEHQLEVDLTLYGDDDDPDRREKFRVQGDLWVLQANIVELEPWVNALGFHSGYQVTRLYGQRLDGVATTQNHIFLNGGDADFFADMRDGKWWTDPFVRSAYGNAVIATPGEYDVYISRDAIKTRAPGS
ncbi:hypothetical protein SAMN04244553_3726 [Nocardia amikacinitolerans]|uniref:Uncharacterized protein n=1 Tax=Nocardia amikacinitolerans TaxID=756689 RepID=A0A285LLE4_9NOCA|nr:hypothetical protein [Nocardia amikacinitolerans]MCP2278756.1 hypothetical protein [Nocardia amikacinitolerans]MCP2298478.1 hypothetical protein [Nocardia amikacinitolerans]MCP2318319.1 hypothetical protein [Nocardia amikacinitolerans]SNY85293.1 hypothetical protein SAMN04244553_3726 [Nocardia amikacinitolerans]